MIKKRISELALCWCLVVLVAQAAVAQTASTPAFWQVNSPTAKMYLLGSMHFGAANFYPLPEAIERAFAASDLLVVEVDITRVTPADAMASIMRHARLPQEQTLSSVLKPATLTLLQRQAGLNGVPYSALQQFQPWFVALQLVEAEIRKTEFQQRFGVDQYFLNKVDNKAVHALESIDAQLGLFSTLSLPAQERFLEQTLRDLSDSQTYLQNLAEFWRAGDVQGLERSLLEPFREQPETRLLYQAIFTDRNASMTERAVTLLAGDRTIFFVVGAGHMIGPDGIVARLRNKGFTVQRVATQASKETSTATPSSTADLP